jgi:hypothetical protein
VLVVLFVICQGPILAQTSTNDDVVIIHITDYGIEQPWRKEMQAGWLADQYDLNTAFPWISGLHVIEPMQSDHELVWTSAQDLAKRDGSAITRTIIGGLQQHSKEFEIQLVENINKVGYFSHTRQQLVDRFGSAAYGAVGEVIKALQAKGYVVKTYFVLASNGTKVFAASTSAWSPYAATSTGFDFVDGRARIGPMSKALDALGSDGQSKVRLFNTFGDWPAPYGSIGFARTSRELKTKFPLISAYRLTDTWRVLDTSEENFGGTHVSSVLRHWHVFFAEEFDSATGTWKYIGTVTTKELRYPSGSAGGSRPLIPSGSAPQLRPPISARGGRSADTLDLVPNAAPRPPKLGIPLAFWYRDDEPPPPERSRPSGPPEDGGGHLLSASKTSSDLGGIDFTTLRLSYVRASGPTAVERVYSMPNGDPSDLTALAGNHDLPGKAFSIAVSMPADAFWVNLNPREPDRIADSRLGKTDVARVLLEADLQLKKDAATITDPRTSPIGQEYWARIEKAVGSRANGSAIVQGIRVWIVPGKIVLAGDNERAYIEQAQMEVKLESQYLETRSQSGAMSGNQEEKLAVTDALARDLVLPVLNYWVNRAPQYEELRQVYWSLVLAQWYREQQGPMEARNSDSTQWLSDAAWTPRVTWLDYMYSLKNGEYCFSKVTTSQQGNEIVTRTERYFDGGVDFTRLPLPRLQPLANDDLKTMNAALSVTRPVLWHDRLWLANANVLGNSLQTTGTTVQTGRVTRDQWWTLKILGLALSLLIVLALLAVVVLKSQYYW